MSDHDAAGGGKQRLLRRRALKLLTPTLLASGLIAGIAVFAFAPAKRSSAAVPLELRTRSLASQRLDLSGLDVTTGTKVGLATFAGQVVIVEFFAAACPECRSQATLIQRRVRNHPGVALIGVDVGDGVGEARSLIANLGWVQPMLLDPRARIAARIGLRALPTTIVLDRRHRTILRANGALDLATLDRALDRSAGS